MKKEIFFLILVGVYGVLWATDSVIHEILGVLLAFLVIIHIVVNRRWCLSLAKGTYSKRRVAMLLSNILIAFFLTAAIITGIMYSKVLFPDLPIHEGARAFKKVHKFFAYGSLVFLITHSWFHWRIIRQYMLKLLQRWGIGHLAR